jgi:hypothetical protein
MTVNPSCETMLHKGGRASTNGVSLQGNGQDSALSAYC